MVDVQMFPLRAASWVGSCLAVDGARGSASSDSPACSPTRWASVRGKSASAWRSERPSARAVGFVMGQTARLAGLGALVGLLVAVHRS